MTTGPCSPNVLKRHGITPEEYQHLCRWLGREPNGAELCVFSVMWSERCSHKSSKVHLSRMPTQGACVVQGPGENAGVVDIGDDLVVVFKIESHSHLSCIEPYQGAATAVGGIIRDIFAMGARPIALMDPLHLGSPDNPKSRGILEGVVAGIAGYGNCMGIPTVGGQTVFSRHFAGNPLVSILCLGVTTRARVFFGREAGIGDRVVYVGARTGRDGMYGATVASEESGEKSREKCPTVQVGDPFMGKLLLEACLEAMRARCVVGIQDLGDAGLSCAVSEIGRRAGTGIEINLELVPQREAGMNPCEILLSESQERMLLVTEPENVGKLRAIFARWGLDAVDIGCVTGDGSLRVRRASETVVEIPNRALTDGAPIYRRPMREPAYLAGLRTFDEESVAEPSDWRACVRSLVAAPNLCRKRWIWERYDHMVRTNTVAGPGSDAAVLRIKGSSRLLALSTDCNPRHCHLDPAEGARAAVAEACRNIVCVGGRPLAATHCLNFASPENPEVMWQFSAAVDGIRDACTALGTPITGGSVSFYNENGAAAVYPTPVIGMLGVVENETYVTPAAFQNPGDYLVLLGPDEVRLSGSEYLEFFHGHVQGRPAPLDLELERNVQDLLFRAIHARLVASAHDCSDGGLLFAALESSFLARRRWGFELRIGSSYSPHRSLFGEGPSRILVSVPEDCLDRIRQMAAGAEVPFRVCGRVMPEACRVLYNERELLAASVTELFEAWNRALESRF
jgi:phosphoribosylformylglycinamidine synthase II